MQYIGLLLIAAATFGVCYLLDRGFSRIFRSRTQHRSGLSVRMNKRYASFGLLLGVVGLAAILVGVRDEWVLAGGGVLVLLAGIGLIVYYMTFGVFYDEESLLLSAFGKKSAAYSYRDIRGQKLYLIQGGNTVVELHMADGRTVAIQSTMEGAYPFLDYAFAAWCRQTGQEPEGCDFHDPAKSLWFPDIEEK